MNRSGLAAAITAVLLATPACHFVGSGPGDEDVIDAVRKSPPSPPTAGPTYLAEIASVTVEDRGRYSSDGKYWPVRVHVKGGVKVKVTNLLQLGLLGEAEKQTPKPIDFVEEGHFAKDDFGKWAVSYNYDPNGPKWRLSATPSGSVP